MKTTSLLIAAGISAIAFASAAQAADLIISPEPIITPMPEVSTSNWDGAFIGVFGGYGWGTLATDDDTIPTPFNELDPSGWLVGVDAGANFELGNGLVVGIVGDLAWADLTDTYDDGGALYNSKTNWTGSLRGRVGFDGGVFMPYLTAGMAVANNTLDIDGVEEGSNTHVGWTAGAGVEFAATENLSVDLQYRYSDYGSQDYNGTDFGLTSHQATVGLHYRF